MNSIFKYLLDFVNQDRLDSRILYVQADHFLMRNHSLYQIAEEFHKFGGKFIAIDEIHRYTNWSLELKSILNNHIQISNVIISAIQNTNKKILPHFIDYLSYDFYPFYREAQDLSVFQLRLEQNMHITIESDLVAIYPHLTGNSLKK